MFLVDGSTSISQVQFKSMQTFMNSIVNLTTVGQDETRFGVILYSNSAQSKFELNAFGSRGKVLQAVNDLVPPTGDTYTGEALKYSLQFFNEEHGGRKKLKVPQVLMVITDGDATDHHMLKETSDALRQNAVSVISIGVKNAIREQLETMAGGDVSKVFFVDNFKELETLYKNMSSLICNTTKQGKSGFRALKFCQIKPCDTKGTFLHQRIRRKWAFCPSGTISQHLATQTSLIKVKRRYLLNKCDRIYVRSCKKDSKSHNKLTWFTPGGKHMTCHTVSLFKEQKLRHRSSV